MWLKVSKVTILAKKYHQQFKHLKLELSTSLNCDRLRPMATTYFLYLSDQELEFHLMMTKPFSSAERPPSNSGTIANLQSLMLINRCAENKVVGMFSMFKREVLY